jgi:hypothetical protein
VAELHRATIAGVLYPIDRRECHPDLYPKLLPFNELSFNRLSANTANQPHGFLVLAELFLPKGICFVIKRYYFKGL